MQAKKRLGSPKHKGFWPSPQQAICSFFIFFLTTLIIAAPNNHLKKSIEPLIQHSTPNADIGIVVTDAETGRVLYQRNGFQAYVPASNEKLLPAAAALLYLGPNYRFHTTLSAKPHGIDHHTIDGNLYITFSGDPSLKITALQNLIARLKRFKINTIYGNVVIDDTRFQAPNYAPGWTHDSINWYFSAPITSIIIDRNNLTVGVTPNKTLNKLATVNAGKGSIFMKVKSHVKTVTHDQAMHHCSILLYVNRKNEVDLEGCWPISGKPVGFKIAVKNPRLLAKQIIKRALIKNHINITGEIIFGKTPKTASILAQHNSAPLSKLLIRTLRKSDNVYAESILKTLGANYYHRGTFQEGVNAMEKILRKASGINFKQTSLFDGSGQSRYNLISPRQITRILYTMYHNKKVGKTFIKALPHSSNASTSVKAKTGTMRGISALSGYITTKNHRKLIFSIMINHIIGKTWLARTLQREIGEILATQTDDFRYNDQKEQQFAKSAISSMLHLNKKHAIDIESVDYLH